MENQRIIDRLGLYMSHKGIKDRQLEQACGISNGMLNNSRKEGRDLGSKSIEKILRQYVDLNRVWLMTGVGEMLATKSKEVVEVVEQGTPVYDIDATCGNLSRPIVFTDEHIIGHVNLPNVSSSAVIIRANGDSMTPHINDGDWIAVREVFNFNELYYGQVYLVITEELRLLKYLRKDEDEQNYVILRSENDRYDDIRLAKSSIRSLFIVENVLSLKIKF
jgi:phage repressor protein C with HTH and peptisase S24 domain